METGILLIQIACAIYMGLGFVHAILTLFTKAMQPSNPEVLALNQSSHAHITSSTSLWLGGVGFHLSHSLGLFVFGAIFFGLSMSAPDIMVGPSFFGIVLIVVPLLYLFLSLKYWFILPSIGLGLACLLCLAGIYFHST